MRAETPRSSLLSAAVCAAVAGASALLWKVTEGPTTSALKDWLKRSLDQIMEREYEKEVGGGPLRAALTACTHSHARAVPQIAAGDRGVRTAWASVKPALSTVITNTDEPTQLPVLSAAELGTVERALRVVVPALDSSVREDVASDA